MLEYINNYLGSPMSVAIDVVLFGVAIGSLLGFVALRRKVDDLYVAIQILKNKLVKG